MEKEYYTKLGEVAFDAFHDARINYFGTTHVPLGQARCYVHPEILKAILVYLDQKQFIVFKNRKPSDPIYMAEVEIVPGYELPLVFTSKFENLRAASLIRRYYINGLGLEPIEEYVFEFKTTDKPL
ncbi:hypothetical protein [Rhodonellum sp.]|uniref:hypothetical protein n=1 Tax=Rhodonellum sp. TaxID=2231180 RepID=UPI002726ACFA|nr:hypothetical protein [Rhodonellum sp.]MDO9554543.1 hypothetical protein [Rhodonellum sp.]